MNGSQLVERNPAEIETEIARTRASLQHKLHELERRLSPRARVQDVRRRLDPEPSLGWAAAAAIAGGALMALAGWRRYRAVRLGSLDDPATADMMGE